MKLLIEKVEEFQVISESKKNGGKNLYITGPFIQTEIVNRNGRLYKKDIVLKEVKRYITEVIEKNRAVGELNHPVTPQVNPERVAIKILSLVEDGNNFIGKAKVLQELPMGKIVSGLINEGVQLGVSTRGVGSLRDEGNYKVVCDDYYLLTAADVVLDPSAPDAFVTALMENKEWIWENGILVEKETEIKDNINKLVKRRKLNEETLTKVFKYILQKI